MRQSPMEVLFYAVKMRVKASGRLIVHSLWADKNQAEHLAALYNHTRSQVTCTVEAFTPDQVAAHRTFVGDGGERGAFGLPLKNNVAP